MGGYIRMDKDLEDDPRIADLGDLLAASAGIDKGLARDAVIGGLYRLWRHADTHLGRHNRLKGASHGPARISEVTALPVSLLERFPTEWLLVHEDGTVELPDYSAKNALVDRDVRRANGRDRTQRWREKKRKGSINGDASHDVTSEASHRHQRVTTGTGTGPGTGTVPSETVEDEDPSDFPPSGKDELPSGGGTPRENGTNPRTLGTNPRAQGTNPRAVRNRSLELWREATAAIDQVASTAALPQGQRLTWAYVAEHIHDQAALKAIERAGGFRAIADRDRFTQGDYEARFREAYEQQLRQEQHA